MPALSSHHSSDVIKLMLIGDSGAGKSGGLASLAAAGYKLRIIDFDNGLDALVNFLTHPESPYVKANPSVAEGVYYRTLTDAKKNTATGKIVTGKAAAWQEMTKLFAGWTEADGTNLGKLADWGADTVLVIDSLTRAADAALDYHLAMNGQLGQTRTQNEARRDIGAAQGLIRNLLELLYDANVKCHVIVMAHITFVSEAGGAPQVAEGKFTQSAQGYPSAIGRALSPHIPRYFNNMLIAKSVGGGRSKIYTKSQFVGDQLINAKNSAPMAVKTEYPLESGLADYFRDTLRKGKGEGV